ncbi:hypothetical protein ERO13_A05G072800v2 [Gossypium hirsutum]|uniref:Uncharacterized protein n=1 Tax=Gossypium tomentosum TaxID=34277 RepID=A0A5D2QCT9_GOSTO|nr:hypothetical protein ERO13_A05G072800v2 [Gossypium hirsutum]TYI25902.1 hypothetical protein ES332_A05G078900v1 [Gossypium tomentosum]
MEIHERRTSEVALSFSRNSSAVKSQKTRWSRKELPNLTRHESDSTLKSKSIHTRIIMVLI